MTDPNPEITQELQHIGQTAAEDFVITKYRMDFPKDHAKVFADLLMALDLTKKPLDTPGIEEQRKILLERVEEKFPGYVERLYAAILETVISTDKEWKN